MKSFQKIAFVLITSLALMSCSDEDPILIEDDSLMCDESTSEFQSLFQSMINDGHEDRVFLDTRFHEYSFSLTADKEVCKIGYQSIPEIESTPYLIEIVDNSSNSTIYSDSHVFSSNNTSFATPSSTINLKSGVSYTLKRIQTNYGQYISSTIGRMAMQDSMNFPYTNGVMTITGSNFHQGDGPMFDVAVPYIDLILR